MASSADVASAGKLQLGSLTASAASCVAVTSDRPYADKDCDGTQDAGEEFLDAIGEGGSAQIYVSGGATAQTIGTTYTDITLFDTDGLETAGVADADVANDRIVIEQSGRYAVTYAIGFSGTGNSEWTVQVAIDGTGEEVCRQRRKLGSGGDVGAISRTCLVDLTATDAVTLQAQADSAGRDMTIEEGGLTVMRLVAESGTGGGSSEYDPDTEPTSGCSSCEDWTGDTAALTWSWQNQGTATETVQMDSARILAPATAGVQLRVRWSDASIPAAQDFLIAGKVQSNLPGQFNRCGLVALMAGSEASPTSLISADVLTNSNFITGLQGWSSYTVDTTDHGSTATGYPARRPPAMYVVMFWDDSEDDIEYWFSFDGIEWILQAEADFTSAGDSPLSLGLHSLSLNASSDAACTWDFFRVLTGQSSPPWIVGE